MAEEKHQHEQEAEIQDRGMFDFLGKKKEEENEARVQDEEVIASEMEKVHVSDPEPKMEEEEKQHESLLEKLHRSGSSSSSVSSFHFWSISRSPFVLYLIVKKI